MPLVVEVVFLIAVISWIAFMGGGWKGAGVEMGAGGEP